MAQEAVVQDICRLAVIAANCLEAGGTIFWCGNGGSAADSQHLAAELVGRFKGSRRALRSIALSTDTSILTSVGNDYGYEHIFARQVEALASAGDILIGISTSGKSENVLRAFDAAKSLGVITVGLFGEGDSKDQAYTDYSIRVPSDCTARIQEIHILVGHVFCDLIEQELDIA